MPQHNTLPVIQYILLKNDWDVSLIRHIKTHSDIYVFVTLMIICICKHLTSTTAV